MGLAASQGRYLCLTARMSDLVYEGQQISQQRLALSNETQAVADEYNDAMNNTVLKVNLPGVDGTNNQQLTYDIITSQDPFNGLCMRIVDLNGNVVVPEKAGSIDVTSKNEKGESVVSNFSSAQEFIGKYLPDLDAEKADELAGKGMEYLVQYYKENNHDSSTVVEYKTNINNNLKSENEHFLYDKNVTDPKYLQEMLTSGQWILQQTTEKDKWDSVTWQGSSAISEIYDTSDDAAAEAKYESAMADIQKKDKVLELRLEQVQTQESAVEKEIDSIKQTISKNIEDSFGTFA